MQSTAGLLLRLLRAQGDGYENKLRGELTAPGGRTGQPCADRSARTSRNSSNTPPFQGDGLGFKPC